jgi:hypothetical protein
MCLSPEIIGNVEGAKKLSITTLSIIGLIEAFSLMIANMSSMIFNDIQHK